MLSQFEIKNRLELAGEWKILRGRIRQAWGKLVGDKSLFLQGEQEELVGKALKRAGATKRALQTLLTSGGFGTAHRGGKSGGQPRSSFHDDNFLAPKPLQPK